MKNALLCVGAFSLLVAAPMAEAATSNYNVTTTWFEPDTQPNDSIFKGSFSYDAATHTVSNLQGVLSESMTGSSVGYPNDTMTWVTLGYQLVSWYDATLGGTLAATFSKNTTATFLGNTWTPEDGVNNGGVFAGGPAIRNYAKSIQNSYALIFVPDNPLNALTSAQLSRVAYADCAPGGMMGATCMTGTSEVYGAIGTMSGVPYSQTITAAVPEPETYAMMMAGLGLVGFMSRRRKGRSQYPALAA